jgi:hypothetical protein
MVWIDGPLDLGLGLHLTLLASFLFVSVQP